MNRMTLAALAAVLIGGGAAAFFLLRPHGPPPAPPSPRVNQKSGHSAGIDRSMTAVLALENAPEGKTSCESAYNAFKASEDASKEAGVKAVVLKLAPRDEFMQRCQALPPLLQTCLAPKYLAAHRQECDTVKPSPQTLAPLVELRRTIDPQRTEP